MTVEQGVFCRVCKIEKPPSEFSKSLSRVCLPCTLVLGARKQRETRSRLNKEERTKARRWKQPPVDCEEWQRIEDAAKLLEVNLAKLKKYLTETGYGEKVQGSRYFLNGRCLDKRHFQPTDKALRKKVCVIGKRSRNGGGRSRRWSMGFLAQAAIDGNLLEDKVCKRQ